MSSGGSGSSALAVGLAAGALGLFGGAFIGSVWSSAQKIPIKCQPTPAPMSPPKSKRAPDHSIGVDEIEAEFRLVQDKISDFLKNVSQQTAREDNWAYDKGSGGGCTRVWESSSDNDALEKAGCAFSGIAGDQLAPTAATAFNVPKDAKFRATGVSLVFHPRNPNVPTIHMNIRYFEAGDLWWFGGGIDLTPYKPCHKDAIGFHRALKEVCQRWGHSYDEHKKTCDKYFHIAHRDEMRGIGGIFFDHLQTTEQVPKTKRELFGFVRDLGMSLPHIYGLVFNADSIRLPFSAAQREFQLIRRSRYVEFNLLYDRGTKFGLQSGGRIESIFLSMPSIATWKYGWVPLPGSDEDTFCKLFLHPQDWASMDPAAPFPPQQVLNW